ncbi:MAG: 50S ribosomal protein L21 [Roseinatronobacter sp.]
MFAVLKTGGKQYRVQTGDLLRVERIAAQAGETVQFNDVLMIGGDSAVIGAPLVDDAAVQAEVIDQIKADKVIHYVKRRRKHSSQRTKGHRQKLTLVKVTDILATGAGASGVKAAIGTGSVSGFVVEAAAPATAPRPKKKEKAASTAADGKPSNLLDAARDDQADDLKKITGLGPKMESLLNEHGVFHFDQMAAWSSEEIAYMDEKLALKGRIERDGWIEQAKQFAAEKE